MAVQEIVSFGACLTEVGIAGSATDAQLGLAQTCKQRAERRVRRWLRCNVVQPVSAYTHILPKGQWFDLELARSRGSLSPRKGRILRLPEYPVRTVTSLLEDENAFGGYATNSFPSSSALVSGSDYHIDVNEAGIGWFGNIIRISNFWPTQAGSIKITYTAGWTEAELDGEVTNPYLDASDIKHGTLKQFAEEFNEVVRQQSGGEITQERLGDYSVTYATESSGAKVALSKDVKEMLNPFKRIVIG